MLSKLGYIFFKLYVTAEREMIIGILCRSSGSDNLILVKAAHMGA